MQRIIGESSTLASTLEQVSRVAPLNRPALIIGERGSGKEMIAERLHFLSRRWDQAFHKVNCAAISEALLDSELFGHEAGAFTGASKTHYGRFERIDGGTLFLDELGTMPLRLQEKLLRIVEYGEFERLGGQKTLQVDVRIVAATHENLPRRANQGLFRHDLLDRLAFDVIHVPPLRKRQEDIPALVEFFATRMCHELEREYYSGFTKEALDRLLNHAWPGNIRELKNVVERSVCHWSNIDEPIDRALINVFTSPFEDQDDEQESTPGTGGQPAFLRSSAALEHQNTPVNFHQKIAEFEIALLQQGLRACHFHQKNTAEYLGMTYHQLRALLKKYPAAAIKNGQN